MDMNSIFMEKAGYRLKRKVAAKHSKAESKWNDAKESILVHEVTGKAKICQITGRVAPFPSAASSPSASIPSCASRPHGLSSIQILEHH